MWIKSGVGEGQGFQKFGQIFFKMLIIIIILKISIQVLNFPRAYLINFIKKFSNPDFIHSSEFRGVPFFNINF